MELKKRVCRKGGFHIDCKIGNRTYESYWSGPLPSIDHVGLEYIKGRYPIITTPKRAEEFKGKYKLLFVTVSTEQMNNMRHTIGLDYKKKPFRNRYVTQDNNADWNDLISKGLAEKNNNNDRLYGKGNAFFWLTKQGVEFVTGKEISNKKYNDL